MTAGLNYTKHIVGELVGGIQRCVICGLVITDYRNAMVPDDTPPLRGFPEGPVYVRANETTTILEEGDEHKPCLITGYDTNSYKP